MDQIVHNHTEFQQNPSDRVSVPALAERIADPMLMLDAQGIMRYCNPSFEALIGRSADTFIGKSVHELLAPDSRRHFMRKWAQRPRGVARPYLATWFSPSGNHVATRVFPTPLVDREGTFLGSIGVIVDWSKQQKVRYEYEIMHRIASEGTSILYRARLEPGFPIDYISTNVQHLGYRAEDMVAGRVVFADIIHEDDRQRVEEQIRKQADSNGTDFQQVFRVRTADGETRWLQDHRFIRRIGNGTRILEGLATDITDAQVAREEHQRALLRTVLALSSAVEKRDPYTAGHQQRVAILSLAIACTLGLDQHTCESIYLGALVHDIGKLAVPAEILSKPTRLSIEETALVKTHVQSGIDVLRGIQLPWSVAEIVAQHHERLDGSGYPVGCKGDAIALEARIVSVADVVEAMSGHRPYRSARGLEAALNELHRQKAILYDERVVDACEEVIRPHLACPGDLWLRLEQDVGNWCQVHHLELIVEHAFR